MPKYDLLLSPPIMNAAGFLGFTPDPRGMEDFPQMGAFVTHPVSLNRRTPARGTRLLTFPGGFLLHTGYPNPGLRQVIRRYAAHWARAPLPVLVHLLAEDASQIAAMVRRLESLEGVMGIELGIPPDASAQLALDMLAAAGGELPVIVRLPLERARQLTPAIADRYAAEAVEGESEMGGAAAFEGVERMILAGLAGISLGSPRGALPGADGRLVHGRLYGPAILPWMLEIVQDLVKYGLPVFAAGGVYRPADIQAVLAAGASGVQLDAVLWRGDWEAETVSAFPQMITVPAE